MGAATSNGRARLVASGRPSLCLDYANTRCWRGLESPTETLRRPADLIAWCRHARLLAAPNPSMTPAASATLFAEAIALRVVIYHAFSALAAGASIPKAELSVLNAAIAVANARARCHQGAAPEAGAVAQATTQAATRVVER